jgi:diphosphomevalonate decarboxylase
MLDKKYRDEALDIRKEDLSDIPKTVAWEAPSNIALIKYWGKKGNQIPLNPSLSMTLSNLNTRTEIHYKKSKSDVSKITFRFENEENHPFGERVKKYINSLVTYFPFLNFMDLHIESQNNFPHSSGLASSASAMSSLALCLCSIENSLRSSEYSPERFYQKASYMARLGSGSAARSVYGNYVEWGEHDYGSDEFANPFNHRIHETFEFLNDSILIISSEKKKLSSRQGHIRMQNHPFKEARVDQVIENMEKMRKSIKEGNFNKFAKVLENEALTLHSLMLSSNPGFILLKQQTIDIIDKIRNAREYHSIPVTFTLDAGPNIHVIYPLHAKSQVRYLIDTELIQYCENGKVLHDFTGSGPERVDKNK